MSNKPIFARASPAVLLALAMVGSPALVANSAPAFSAEAVAAMSPVAELVQPFEAMRLGKKYVAEHAGTDFLVGSGDSMLPLYKDHTVVVTKKVAMRDLKAGMTAVYFGESGRPVAHVLIKKTWDGWIAMGVGNAKCDTTRVTSDNLMGIVVQAFQPTSSPMLALLNEANAKSSVASMP